MIRPEIKTSILILRQQGETYAGIATALGLSPNTVKSVCRRKGVQTAAISEPDPDVCKNCGEPLVRIPGKKPKAFCSTHCRTVWWNKARSREPYWLNCHYCGKGFISFGNRKKKFYSRECRRFSRYGESVP